MRGLFLVILALAILIIGLLFLSYEGNEIATEDTDNHIIKIGALNLFQPFNENSPGIKFSCDSAQMDMQNNTVVCENVVTEITTQD